VIAYALFREVDKRKEHGLTIRVAIADDHPTLLAGLEHLLARSSDFSRVGSVTNSTELVELLGKTACDVVVTDFSMPHGRYGDGLSLLRFLKRRFPSVRVVVLTGIDNHVVMRGILEAGAVGIVGKSDDLEHIEPAIRAAHVGDNYLSPKVQDIFERAVAETSETEQAQQLSKRETEVLRLFAEGLTISQIGARAGRSNKTISAQKMAAMRKLGLQHDADIFKYALTHGLVTASQASRQSASSDESTDDGDI
jgi:two-component system, NarL family, captular synthesis response regulator RcsB